MRHPFFLKHAWNPFYIRRWIKTELWFRQTEEES